MIKKNQIIETVAYIFINDKKLLLVRAKNKKAYYMPGGKRDLKEDDIRALVREIREELQIELSPSLQFYGVFEAQAYGKEKGVRVKIICYFGKHLGRIKAGSEIEQIRFFSQSEYFKQKETAPAVRLIFNDLKEKDLIE
ncbi:hypothetical protein A2866_04745 [Candidatus Roizmanbacteria bacterium RIFCSPHIGHO2_01_FULL_39_8]|uniref:Nudix hydrolase domain-containing protein n=2 Tax=Candidatus Roizmaniibacteriota TaxID=1752723 RepID=A0A1F7GH56_9BACT|nr:MAG: hypothetical protein A2866_04745 [Candidatus Roizmanbacteria bacterium RIFCSPHIGHO2_01_FULL_39_8]OGK28508.1 MAG: hypothetical protein A3C28_01925 [Candidatus Roizmanbacteria bacterium RIFCSPHIGHO2_02_FULL_39_9]